MSAPRTPEKRTIRELMTLARRRLEAAVSETPALDARLLLSKAAGLSLEQMAKDPDQEVPPQGVAKLEALLRRRQDGVPIAQILGVKAFWADEFLVSEAVLSPRPESELFIELAKKRFPANTPLDVLDLGTGSGCLILSLLREFPLAKGVGTDKSQEALRLARANADNTPTPHRAAFVCGHWAEAIAAAFDLIVANPPYLTTQDWRVAQDGPLRFEPRMALDGGEDGLGPYPEIAKRARHLLKPSGLLLFEIGASQGPAVEAICRQAGFSKVKCHQDLAGLDRVISAEIV